MANGIAGVVAARAAYQLTNEGNDMNYQTPELNELGSIAELTNGQGGSSIDGNGSFTQTGGGNDSDDS